MAIYRNRGLKAVLQVNTGTSASPDLKNRPLGTGYIITPTAELSQIYQAGVYFAALQAHERNDIWVEQKGTASAN